MKNRVIKVLLTIMMAISVLPVMSRTINADDTTEWKVGDSFQLDWDDWIVGNDKEPDTQYQVTGTYTVGDPDYDEKNNQYTFYGLSISYTAIADSESTRAEGGYISLKLSVPAGKEGKNPIGFRIKGGTGGAPYYAYRFELVYADTPAIVTYPLLENFGNLFWKVSTLESFHEV